MKTSDLRVISGQYKGQRLRSPESALTHPMGAREKLALFNLLQPAFFSSSDCSPAGPKVLDLYAGSGALGIEALSRGAREVVFVEKSPRIARLISDNLANLKNNVAEPPLVIRDHTTKNPPSASSAPLVKVFSTSVTDFCQRPEYLSYFDIVIADPPYDDFRSADLSSISQILTKDGIFILSSPARVEPPALPGLQQTVTRTYAAARLTVYVSSQNTKNPQT